MAPKGAKKVAQQVVAPNGKKRAASQMQVAAKVARLGANYADVTEQQEQAERDLQIALIVQELQTSPHKVKPCLRAVHGTQFDQASSHNGSFPSSSLYLFKLPRGHLEEWFDKANKKVAPLLKAGLKKDSLNFHRWFYRVTLTDQASYIPKHDKAAFDEIMTERSTACGNKFTLKVDEQGDIKWVDCGVYALYPARPAGHDGIWNYEGTCFNEGEMVSFVGSALQVSSAWTVRHNWSIKRVVLQSPATDPIPISKACCELFKGKEAFGKLFAGYMLSDKFEADGTEEKGARDAIALVSGAVAPTSGASASKSGVPVPPPSARRTLTAGQRKAPAGLKALSR